MEFAVSALPVRSARSRFYSRHLAYMLEESITSRAESIYFNSLASPASVLDFLAEGGYVPQDGGQDA